MKAVLQSYANKFDRESRGITPWTSTPQRLCALAEFSDHTGDRKKPISCGVSGADVNVAAAKLLEPAPGLEPTTY
jgi:hypothetical protein